VTSANARRVYACSQSDPSSDTKVDIMAEMFDSRRWSAGGLLGSIRLRHLFTEQYLSTEAKLKVADMLGQRHIVGIEQHSTLTVG